MTWTQLGAVQLKQRIAKQRADNPRGNCNLTAEAEIASTTSNVQLEAVIMT
jgi:hypothetical protein